MPLTFTETDGQSVAVVDTEQDYPEAVEVLGISVIFTEDPLIEERDLRWLIDLVVGEGDL